jgi:FtsH-binding integral membrane protein
VTDIATNPVAGITVNWAAATGGGSVGGATSVTNGSGIATQTATLGATGGANTFTATVAGLTGSPLTFSATAAKVIAKTSGTSGDFQTGAAGAQLSLPLSVTVTDNASNPVAGITVNWAAASGGGSVGGATSVTNASGIATQTATLGTAGGANSYTATVAGLTGSPLTFTATAAKTIAVSSGNNQTGVAGTQLSTALSVHVTDGSSNPVAGITVNWAAASGGGSVGGATSVTDGSGIATQSATLGATGGANTFTATVVGLTGSPLTFSATAAKVIAIQGGNGQTAANGTQLATPLSVKVTDGSSNAVAGITVNWAAASGGSVGGATSVTDVLGVATQTATLPASTGVKTYTATVPGLTGSPVTFIETAN